MNASYLQPVIDEAGQRYVDIKMDGQKKIRVINPRIPIQLSSPTKVVGNFDIGSMIQSFLLKEGFELRKSVRHLFDVEPIISKNKWEVIANYILGHPNYQFFVDTIRRLIQRPARTTDETSEQ
jgi:hypothetical protein